MPTGEYNMNWIIWDLVLYIIVV